MPEYRVLRIEEQMYGCEELPAGQPVLCDVVLEGTDGACCTLPCPSPVLIYAASWLNMVAYCIAHINRSNLSLLYVRWIC